METFLPPPIAEGSAQDQIVQMRDYLFGISEQLNLALQSLDAGNFAPGSKAVQILSGSTPEDVSRVTRDEISAVKSIIIKTADIVQSNIDRISATLTSDYLAKSEYGSYFETNVAQITQDASGFNQKFKYFSDIQSNIDTLGSSFSEYKDETEGSIMCGIVGYSSGDPIYGVAIGQEITSDTITEADGKTRRVLTGGKFRSVFTANELSFWITGTDNVDRKLAYFSGTEMYISSANVENTIRFGTFERTEGPNGSSQTVMSSGWQITRDNGLKLKWIT